MSLCLPPDRVGEGNPQGEQQNRDKEARKHDPQGLSCSLACSLAQSEEIIACLPSKWVDEGTQVSSVTRGCVLETGGDRETGEAAPQWP